VLSFFMFAPNQLPLELTPTADGCQLSLHYATGVIVERFPTISSALRRVDQLNDLLIAPPGPVRRPRRDEKPPGGRSVIGKQA
jgi:hypothetical protein